MRHHLLVLLLLSALVAAAQTNTSVVEGRVFDPSRAGVNDCTVELKSLATGGTLTTRTNETGMFVFPAVPVGSYSLKVTKDGFNTYEISEFRVTIGQRVTHDIEMQLGAMSQSVTVVESDAAPLLEPSSNELGTLIESVNVQQLPLNGRNYLQLGYLSGAAQDGGPTGSDFLATQTGHADRDISIAGVEPDLIGFTVNGISVAGSRLGDLALNVSISAVDQFKVVQGFIMPAMGPDPGIVNVVTKSGANQFHGEAFEFLRNNALDARNFFEAQAHPGPFRRNQFGAAVGGPIARDRVFFYAHYDGTRQVLAAPQGGFSPTQAMFDGDFSEFPAPIYDPQSFNPATNQRQPFAGNVIPQDRINSMARNLLPYYLPGASYTMRPLNVFREPVQTQNSDQGGMRVDVNLSKNHTLFGQFIHEESPVDNPALFPVSGLFYHMNTAFAMAQLTSTLGARVVNELHVGFTRPYLFYGGIGQDGLQTKIGLTGTADVNGVPGITLGGFSSFGTPQSIIGNIDNNYQVYDSLKLLLGKHELAVGASLHYVRTTQESANWNARGTLVFNSVFSSQLAPGATGQLAPVPGTGSSFADFLLGTPVSGTVTSMPRTHYRWTEVNPYLQDTWRIRPGFTLNFGLGWYVATPPNPSGADRNYPHAFDFNTGKVLYAALGQIDPKIFSTTWTNFSPRVGFAWQPGFLGGTVIRAGAGIYYPSQRALYDLFGITAPGVSIVQSLANSPSAPEPTYLLGRNVFPPISQVPITQEFADNLTGTVLALDQGLRTSYSQQWNLSIQHNFGKSFLAELTYVGSQSRRLPVRWNVDDCSVPGSLVCDDSVRPWPQYSYVYFAANAAYANYHALNAKFQRQFAGGFNFLANYTWSKTLTNTMQGGANAPLNQMGSCLDCDKGLAPFNVPHRLAAASVFELPVGRGKRFLRNAAPVWNGIAGGWAVNVIAAFSSGNPFTVNAPNNTVAPLTNFRANRLCDGRKELGDRNVRTNGLYWFDTGCFAAPLAGYFGDSGAFILTGPGVNNWDIALEKNAQIRELMKVQFRAELFNAWNHAQFRNPNSMVGDANFGQIVQARNAREVQLGMKVLW
ncbi:MAG: carboxypeptidase regulatory-like domain-containing protein [Acidobacteriota bacterium]